MSLAPDRRVPVIIPEAEEAVFPAARAALWAESMARWPLSRMESISPVMAEAAAMRLSVVWMRLM